MEIKIGIQNVAREVVIDSEASAVEVTKAVRDALAGDGLLTLSDEKGRQILIPVAGIAYLELGQEHARRVGFSTN